MRKLKAKECTWLVSEVTCRMSSPISFYLSLIFHPILFFPEVKFHAWNWQGSRARVSSLEWPWGVKEEGGNGSGLGIFLDCPPSWSISLQPHPLQPTTHSQSGWLTLYFLFEESWNCICLPQTVVLSFADTRTWYLHCSLVKSVYQNIVFEGIGSHDFTCQDSWF